MCVSAGDQDTFSFCLWNTDSNVDVESEESVSKREQHAECL